MDGDTKVRQLRPGGCHYWEENRGPLAASPNPTHTHLSKLSWWRHLGHLKQDYIVSGHWGSTRTTGLFRVLESHHLPHSPMGGWSLGTEVTLSERRHTTPQEIKGFVCSFVWFLPQQRSGGPDQCRRLVCHLLEEKENLINLLKRDHS